MKAFLEAVHSRWAADTTLNGLLDSSKFFTGTHFKADPPFAWITIESEDPTYANGGFRWKVVQARIQISHTDYDDGHAIKEAFDSAFNRKSFDIDGGRVIGTRVDSVGELQEDDGSWRFIVDLSAIVQPEG